MLDHKVLKAQKQVSSSDIISVKETCFFYIERNGFPLTVIFSIHSTSVRITTDLYDTAQAVLQNSP
jgi:hypothetical protein